MRARAAAAAFAVVLALAVAASPAQAIELKLWGQPLRIDITESLFTSYHGDLGYLVIEHDSSGRATPENHFYDVLNRLNVVLAWKRFRLATRFDTSLYFDNATSPAPGACQPGSVAALKSRFCQGGYQYFWPEKISIEYSGRNIEAVIGDFYISLGRGLVLSLRKIDELGIDTTLQGGRFVFREGNLNAILAVGATNIQNIDEATGRYAADPHDLIAAGRVEYRAFDKVIVGLHEVGGVQNTNVTNVAHKRQDGMMMYGGSLDAPRLLPWLGIYFEGAGQMKVTSDKRDTGYALYGAATSYFGPVSLQAEFKHYVHFQRWISSVDPSLAEFAPIVYNQPPTVERVVTELLSPIYDVSGPRLTLNYRVTPWFLLFASYGYFEDRGADDGKRYYHDPYAGSELRWQDGRSHFFTSGGYRLELCDSRNTTCLNQSPVGGEFQHIGHVEWDGTQTLPHGVSIETQGFALFRHGEVVSLTDMNGVTVFPDWTEGDAYLAVKWTPHLVFTGGFEWSTRPSAKANQYFVNGAVQWNFTSASSVRLFVGGTRGGLKCISGVCRDFPAFTGARLEVVVRL